MSPQRGGQGPPPQAAKPAGSAPRAAQRERELRKAQMAAAAARRAEPDARPAGRTAIRSKPIRITLDLSPELYRELTVWADSAALELGVPRVSLAAAVRAMIRVTSDQPDPVLDRLRQDRDKLARRAGHGCRLPDRGLLGAFGQA
jgi:hypothetical protein